MSKHWEWDLIAPLLAFFTPITLTAAMFPFLPSTKAEQAEAAPRTKVVYHVTLVEGGKAFRQWETNERPLRRSHPSGVEFGGINIVGGTVLIERIEKEWKPQ